LKNLTTTLDGKWSVTRLNNSSEFRFQSNKLLDWLDQVSWIGVDRYAAKHWVALHPDVKPC
jgi:hypothetical protein